MREITNYLNSWRKYLMKDCQHGCKETGVCHFNHHCTRMKMAEVWAYRDAVIPNEYRNFTIDDFTGEVKDGKRVIKPSIVGRAKDAVIRYCWNGIEEGEEYDAAKWLEKSAMPHRREFGTNILIYGDPWITDTTGGLPKTFKRPLGRTMLASVILKEAVNLRMKEGTFHLSDRYGWIGYSAMANMLMERANGRVEYEADIWHYETADWLVLDGLEMRKDAGISFRASVLDQFFTARLQGNRPNILVFQDDISKYGPDELRDFFGIHVSQIINSSKTHHVALVDK